jgi:hypothetical protein
MVNFLAPVRTGTVKNIYGSINVSKIFSLHLGPGCRPRPRPSLVITKNGFFLLKTIAGVMESFLIRDKT